MPQSLSGRLLSVAITLVVIAMLAASVAMYFALHRFVQGQVDGRLDGQIFSARDALRVASDTGLSLDPVANGPPFDRPRGGWYWKVVMPSGTLRSPSLGPNDFNFKEPAPEQRPGPERRPETADGIGPDGEPLRVRVQSFDVAGRSVLIAAAAPLHALRGPLREALWPVAVTLGVLGLTLIGGVVLQVRFGLRPLVRLTEELHRVRTGKVQRIEGPQPAEVTPLVAELNTLLDQNDANLERARRHVANLAHGLKTPLATLAVVMEETGADDRLKPLVTVMDRRIRHHLARARLAALGGPERARTLLAQRAADHVEAFGKIYADKDLRFEGVIPPDIVVACEAQDLDELLGNLLDNACKWAREGVRVMASANGTRVDLIIEDDGPGLSDAQALEMMRPGRRIDENAPGYGFGLPIARELVELYGGTILLSRAGLGGLRVAIALPAAL
jgi:signal transduction histidine kinase